MPNVQGPSHRPLASAVTLFLAASAVVWPARRITAQGVDSTAMPPLEALAEQAGRDSRRHPIGSVGRALLCEPSHPLVDSASLAACASLDSAQARAIVAAFARGLDVPLATTPDPGSSSGIAICPTDLDRGGGPRVLHARLTAPLAGVRDGRWEARLIAEVRCRSPGGGEVTTMGKESLYQWDGRAWQLYQFAWLRAER